MEKLAEDIGVLKSTSEIEDQCTVRYRHPDEKEIYKFIKEILMKKLCEGTINTEQYRSLLGFARSDSKKSERHLRTWFIKHDKKSWEEIEKYIDSSIVVYRLPLKLYKLELSPIQKETIEIDISK